MDFCRVASLALQLEVQVFERTRPERTERHAWKVPCTCVMTLKVIILNFQATIPSYWSNAMLPSRPTNLSSNWWGGAGGGIASTAGRSCSCGYWGSFTLSFQDQVSSTIPAPAWQVGMALLPGLVDLQGHQPQQQEHLLLHPHLIKRMAAIGLRYAPSNCLKI